MNKKSILLSILFVTFLILPIISAVTVDLNFPYNQQIDIKRPCLNNGTYCSAASTCNLTVTYPNGELLVDNKLMTNKGSYHNYTILQENNNRLGVHPSIMSCTDGTLSAADTFNYEITGDGFSFKGFPLEFIGFITAFVFVVVGSTNDKLKLFKTTGGLFFMVMGVIALYPGFANINYSTLFGKMVGFSSIGLGFFFMIQDAFSYDKQVDHYDQDDDGRYHD